MSHRVTTVAPPVLAPPLPLPLSCQPPPFVVAPPVAEPSAESVNCQPLARSPVNLYVMAVGLTALGVWLLLFSFALWMRSADEVAAPSGPAVELTPEVLIQSASAAPAQQEDLLGDENPLVTSVPEQRFVQATRAKPEPTTISLTNRRSPERPPTKPLVPTTSKVPPTKNIISRIVSKKLSQNLAQKSDPFPDGSCKAACTSGVCTPEKINGTLGTALMWTENVAAANSQAKEEDKLVFLLHVSGNFAREEFT